MFLSDPNAAPLTPAEAETLVALVEADGSLLQATRSRGISAADLLALIRRPAAHEALESLRAFAAIRRELRAEAIRDELVAILRDVARAAPDQADKRLAASTALRALTAGSRRSQPSPPLGGSVAAGRSPQATRGAPSSTPPTPPPRSVIHRAHGLVAPVTGDAPPSSRIQESSAPSAGPQTAGTPTSDSCVGAPPTQHAAGTSAVAERSTQHDSRSTQHDSDLVALLAAEEAHDLAEDARLDEELDEELDAELDEELDADPEGTLAIAHQVLQAVQADPHAYPPEAINAARVYIQLAHDPSTDHPPRPP